MPKNKGYKNPVPKTQVKRQKPKQKRMALDTGFRKVKI